MSAGPTEQKMHRVQLHHAPPGGKPVGFEAIRDVRGNFLSKTPLDAVLKPAVKSIAFIFDDTPIRDALDFLATQETISVRLAARLAAPFLSAAAFVALLARIRGRA